MACGDDNGSGRCYVTVSSWLLPQFFIGKWILACTGAAMDMLLTSSIETAPMTDVLRYSELPLYPPYRKNQLVMIPLNRSIVLGPQEVRGINLPLRFLPVALQHLFVALLARSVDFIFKTDGCRIWGVLHNLSTAPQHLSPQFDLLACRTTTTQYSTPD